MNIRIRLASLALEVFAADEAAVNIERAQRHTTLLVEIEVKHVSSDLT